MRTTFQQVFDVTLGLLFAAVQSQAAPLDYWHWRNPLPQGNDLYSSASGNGTFLLAGYQGNILSSTDGGTWTLRSLSPLVDSSTPLIFAKDRFMAFGADCTAPECSPAGWNSADGVAWSEQPSGTNYLSSVIFANGLYVGTAGNELLTSLDAVNWIPQSSITNGYFAGLAYGNGLFVAWSVFPQGMYQADLSRLMTSADGTTWTPHFGDGAEFRYDLPRVTFGNGLFVAGGSDYVSHHDPDQAVILTSPDGVVWSRIDARIVGDVMGE
jgi:hypothetical protein